MMRRQDPLVLLINPWIYDFAAHDYWSKPLGLLYLAGLLTDRGYRAAFVDCLADDPEGPAPDRVKRLRRRRHGKGHFRKTQLEKPDVLKGIPRQFGRYGISEKRFRSRLAGVQDPLAVLVTSGMTYWYPGPHRAIEIVKEMFPRVPVILGGIYATLLPGFARRFSGADHVLPGWAVRPLLALLENLGGRSASGPEDFSDLDRFPRPRYDLMAAPDAVALLTSRGCPFRCRFCASSIFSPRFQQRDPGRVYGDMVYYHETLGVRDMAFYDDALLVNKERHLVPLLKRLAAARMPLRLHTPNGMHPDAIDAETALSMKEAGFSTIRLSLESTDLRRQREMQGKVSSRGLAEAARRLEEAGFPRQRIGVYVMMGLPGQIPREVEASIQFVHDLGVRIHLTSFTPIPGTAAWRDAVARHGFDPESDPLLHNNTIYPLRRREFPYKTFKALKDRVSDMNRALN
jgi:radical SAM superfamily enzyme YgiQ (UPF0313 family)